MEIGAILFSLAMILLTAAYVLQPLSGPGKAGDVDTNQELSALQAERDRVLDAIQEIDMDHYMGKVPDGHHQRQRNSLVLEGAEILRSIDELSSNGTSDGLARELEAAVADFRSRGLEPGMELEAAVAQMRRKGSTPDVLIVESEEGLGDATCPECGDAIFQGDRFCSNCGAALEEQVA